MESVSTNVSEYKIKNKNYYVVGDAGFARPRNTLKIISNFFLINQSINQSINRVFLGRLTRRQKFNKITIKWKVVFSATYNAHIIT